MSSSYPKPGCPGGVPFAALFACMVAAPAPAAEYYNQPKLSVVTETDSNPAYDPTINAHFIEGYTGEVETLLGMRTPTSDTSIRPHLSYQDFPQDSGNFNRLEEYLDLREAYHSQRSTFNLLGDYDHRSDLKAAFPDARFDTLGGINTVTVPETGHVITGGARTQILLVPDYSYRLTQRIKLGASGVYQSINYSPETLAGRVDFNYYMGKATVGWSISPRSNIDIGAVASQYSAKHFTSRTTSYGGTLDYITHLSQLFTNTVSLVYQKNDVNQQFPVPFTGSVNSWSATDTLVYQGPNWHVTFVGGRVLTPSGAGGLYATEQARLQYDKNITARLSITAAGRWLRDQALRTNALVNNLDVVNRRYLRLEASLKYYLAPTWFVTGGYQYGHQRYEIDPSAATNHQVIVSLNYQGLGPR